MGLPKPPANYSKKLLPVAIDEIASKEPNRPWASLPHDDWDLAQGFEDVSFAALANAINKLAHAIEAAFGRSSTFETFAYLGVPDVRYHIVQMAAIKTGYKVLLSSPLNSTNVQISLMESTGCVAILSALGVVVNDILRALPVKHALIADLDDLLSLEERAPPYPFNKTWEEGKFDPYMVLHSSGTTGNPKPVEYKHIFYGNAWDIIFLPDVHGREHYCDLLCLEEGTRFLITSAPFHVMSATCAIAMTVFGRGIFHPGYRHRVMSTSEIGHYLKYANVTKAAMTPWMMEDIAVKPDAQRYIERLDSVLFGGAILSPFASSVWAKYTHIQNGWGCTEAIAPCLLKADREDHAYVYFDTVNTGIEFRKSQAVLFDEGSQVQVYEIVLTMNEKVAPFASWHVRQGMTPENTKPPYPDFYPGDLWTAHPDPEKASYVFKFVGRTDDTFTLSSASNIHPGPIERAISVHPKAAGVMIVGNQRRQPLALIEVAEGIEPSGDTAAEIWESVIKDANANMPAHATITRTHVALVPPGSLIRTPIGKIIRKKTEAKLAGLIDGVYREFGDNWQGKYGRMSTIVATTSISVEVTDSPETIAEED
ncbi:Acetyl-coenzyme A synthetase 1 [Cytospora mali]|uniref:Acetyl-coenzyme A synthetase 1 n=1 Tax=Cytospora mali TaxID=578113 RepID=A0A194W6U0_CYTMA|nr:Acetyl-coenzyme A synthetase 1 [Valsa mali]